MADLSSFDGALYVAMALLSIQSGVIIYLLSRKRKLTKKLRQAKIVKSATEEKVAPIEPRLPRLAIVARSRFPQQDDAENILPELDFDIDAAFREVIPESSEEPESEETGRRSFRAHGRHLYHRLQGHRHLEYYNSLSISYLRRNTPFTADAKAIFFRIWDEKGEELCNELTTRWIISTLMTFADHGRGERERMCGALGYTYGAMLVASETERTYWTGPAPSIDRAVPDRDSFGVNGCYPFQLGESDHLINLNSFVYRYALDSGISGLLLERLITRMRYSDTYFSRFDTARRVRKINTRGDDRKRFWSFGAPPKRDGRQLGPTGPQPRGPTS